MVCPLWDIVKVDWLTGEIVVNYLFGFFPYMEFVQPLLQWHHAILADSPAIAKILRVHDKVIIAVSRAGGRVNIIGIAAGEGASGKGDGENNGH